MTKPATKRPAAKPAEPVNVVPALQEDDARVFAQGRTAALGSISEEDAPYDKSDPNHAAWLKGHKSV